MDVCPRGRTDGSASRQFPGIRTRAGGANADSDRVYRTGDSHRAVIACPAIKAVQFNRIIVRRTKFSRGPDDIPRRVGRITRRGGLLKYRVLKASSSRTPPLTPAENYPKAP